MTSVLPEMWQESKIWKESLMQRRRFIQLAVVACSIATTALSVEAETPNVVIVISDDQGYGDLGCTGNPIIETSAHRSAGVGKLGTERLPCCPNLFPHALFVTDRALDEPHRGLAHDHGPFDARENEVTVGQMFSDAGYETGMFGKWHLGDNYPYRPEDRGFTEVYRHGGGGIGQTPDVWDNAYFDGSYFHNGEIVPAKGFCTDVFFEQANAFISKCAKQESHSSHTSLRTHPTSRCTARRNISKCMKGSPTASLLSTA